MTAPLTEASVFRARRTAFLERFRGAALLAAGMPTSRNFPANHHPFRASSHFLYFVGRPIEGGALLFNEGRSTLFVHPPDPVDALWHGPRPSLEQLREELALDDVRPLEEIDRSLEGIGGAIACLPTEDAASAAWLSDRLDRRVMPGSGSELSNDDATLADVMVALRLTHDEAAMKQLRFAAEVSAQAHIAGMQATQAGTREYHTLAAMIQVLRAAGLEDAYGPIVTVKGEILHSREHDGLVQEGDLLLADVGGETPEGWAADITRVWPVSGVFSKTQRAIYDVVLAAQDAAIAACQPGRSYRDVHEAAKRSIVIGLRDLGILHGEVDGLLERGAAAVFFPHGVGHILGLDVHDMEDLGDRAGYAPGCVRSTRFGDAYLRLDRQLEPGMLVTIEPGFYQVPGILGDETYTGALGKDLDRAVLSEYDDVRGIRIEDDVFLTAKGNEVLTGLVPKDANEVEAVMRG